MLFVNKIGSQYELSFYICHGFLVKQMNIEMALPMPKVADNQDKDKSKHEKGRILQKLAFENK